MSMIEVVDRKVTFDSLFALMENIENEVNRFDLKNNFDKYSARNIKKLANMLIDSVCD